MTKYNYSCLNRDCKSRNEQIQSDLVFKEQEKEVVLCLECEQPMKLMGESPSGGFCRFSSLSSDQKKEALKKRANNHFAKHGDKTIKKRINDDVSKNIAKKISGREIE